MAAFPASAQIRPPLQGFATDSQDANLQLETAASDLRNGLALDDVPGLGVKPTASTALRPARCVATNPAHVQHLPADYRSRCACDFSPFGERSVRDSSASLASAATRRRRSRSDLLRRIAPPPGLVITADGEPVRGV